MPKLRIKLPWQDRPRAKRSIKVGLRNTGSGLHPPERMQAVIQRERARSDRLAVGFSMLVITADNGRTAKDTLTRIADYLSSRLRLTDELGWLDDHQLCGVLSTTMPSGAWKVAESIRNGCAHGQSVEFKVYYYPSDDVRMEDDSLSERRPPAEPVPAEPMEPLFAQSTSVWKRLLDIVGSILAAIILSPILILAAIAIRLTSPGPILFGQWRSGRGGKPFRMYKFRSMVVDAEARKKELIAHNEQDGPAFKIRSDPRVTWIGKILRSTSIDEMPQLWNVFNGEMSLVGPRPLPCDEAASCRGWQRQRVDVKPGMTGIWQLHGRSSVAFDDWMRMDIAYIRGVSFVGDVKLLAGTLPVVMWRMNGC
jgi:lipopolysaccharide/colanic/teichoic acid biosynthesis glycosyltransferase